ncbi:hypothetical protein ABTG52_13430, partial [Acinetobacter baumannii]
EVGDSSTTNPNTGVDPFTEGDDTIDEKDSKMETSKESDMPQVLEEKKDEINLRPMGGTSKININKQKPSPLMEYHQTWERLYTRMGLVPGKSVADW